MRDRAAVRQLGRDRFRHAGGPTAGGRHLQRRSGPLGLQPLGPVLVAAELLRLLRRLGLASPWLAPPLVTARAHNRAAPATGPLFLLPFRHKFHWTARKIKNCAG